MMRERCPLCGSTNIIYDEERGERVCGSCGYVIEKSVIDTSAEWRAFEPEEALELSRVGPPERAIFHDKGLSTKIIVPRKTSPEKLSDYIRIKKLNSRISDSNQRALRDLFALLRLLCEKLSLPEFILERACVIARKAREKGLERGRPARHVALAALYAACREFDVPVTVEEMLKEATAGFSWTEEEEKRLMRRGLWRCYSLLVKHGITTPKEINIKPFIRRLVERLELPTKVVEDAMRIYEEARKARLTVGRNPIGFVAACVLVASRLNGIFVSQKVVARAIGVTEVTVRNRCKDLAKIGYVV